MERMKILKKKSELPLTYFILIVAAFIAVFPYIWVVLSSLKPDRVMMVIPPSVTFTPQLRNYRLIMADGFMNCLRDSVIVAIGSSLLAVSCSTMAAYGLTRFRYRGRETLAYMTFAMRFIPFITLLIPLYTIVNNFGLLGSRIGLIIAYQLMHIPWMTWLIRSFFLEIPLSYEEAAMVDGLTKWGTFFRIGLPMVAPAVGAAMLLGIIFSWNQYFIPLMLGGRHAKPLTLGLYRYVGSQENPMLFGSMAAWAALTMTPVVVLSVVVRKHLVNAFTGGSS